jgi:pyruvate dehydrogenase (quinone)
MSHTVAELFVETLKSAGVTRVWGLPGDSLNAFTDVLRHDTSIRWMHVRHEESAAFAAAAEAEMTGELAVVAGSCGPGNLHFINGLFDAQRSRVPVLAIASHIPSAEIGSGYFQETHPQELFRECSVYTELVSDPSQLPWVLEIAMRTAVEKRGVAVVVVPGDVFFADAPDRRPSAPIRATEPRVLPAESELRAAAELLDAAGKVTILAGAGVAGAHAEVMALAEKLRAPIVHAFRGKQHIEYDNPYDVGMTGLLGFASGYRAMEHCDTLLMLGTDFPYRQFYPSKAKIIQIDIRGEQLGRRTPIDLGLVGGVRETAAALLPLLRDGRRDAHLKDSLAHYAKTRRELDGFANDDGKQPIHPQYVARLIDELAAKDAVFTADVGTPVIWAARYLRMTKGRRLIGSFTHGSMANAMPHALGAQATDPGRQVIALAGDGGLAMLMGDLISIRQNDLPDRDHRVQQLVAELRRTRDEGRRNRAVRHGSAQPGLRRGRALGRHRRHPGREGIRARGRAHARPRRSRPRARRCRRGARRAVDPALDHGGAGEGLRALCPPHRDVGARRRTARPCRRQRVAAHLRVSRRAGQDERRLSRRSAPSARASTSAATATARR